MMLIVNNGGQYTHLINRSFRDLRVQSKLVKNDLTLNQVKKADGVVLSGGPSLKKAGNSRKYSKNLDKPVLGICLGHQVIAEAFGGKVGKGEKGGYAETEIEIKGNALFKGLGNKLKVWGSHTDEVKKLPSKFEVTAASNICDIEAMSHVKKPIHGVQFHPEVHHTDSGEKILKNFAEICKNFR